VSGARIDPRLTAVVRPLGFQVVLADDAGHRALRAWLARDPNGTPLPALLDRPDDDIWTTQGIPEELGVRLMSAAGGRVTGVEIHPDRADIEEVTEQTCTARIELGGPSGTRHVTARLDLGLTLAVVSGAPVLVADAVMDRLAVTVPDDGVMDRLAEAVPDGGVMERLAEAVPDGDALAPLGAARAGRERAVFVVDREAGRVFQVAGDVPGPRPRFEPRNMSFGEGLDRWDLHSAADYSATAEGGSAVLFSVSEEPRGSARLAQTIFADDYRGATVAFGGEIRAEDVTGQADLRVEILGQGWRVRADRRAERTVSVTGSQDWSRREITMAVPEDTDVIRFGITLAGRGRVWLRQPELRRERARDAGSAGVD
jgi:hypothetical protein